MHATSTTRNSFIRERILMILVSKQLVLICSFRWCEIFNFQIFSWNWNFFLSFFLKLHISVQNCSESQAVLHYETQWTDTVAQCTTVRLDSKLEQILRSKIAGCETLAQGAVIVILAMQFIFASWIQHVSEIIFMKFQSFQTNIDQMPSNERCFWLHRFDLVWP